ncbi:hypothetical protein [Actinoplanes aureus]|uniref:DUF5666 domain-containing protein n=1 Tax=Actinoplanes aureus TaxID=2792083 RepID=A0A931FWC9_9ACTN|nr:hypothetical protein [Actinoplanes aureus]MBG0562303.1 hypothetical protein [Actinoplanes aureus]
MNDETGLSAELAAAAPKRWWNKGTVALGVAALLMGGFLGGVQAQKQWGTPETNAVSGFPGGGMRGSGGFPGPAQTTTTAAAGPTTGKVKLVNGKTIYVETGDGTVVTIKTGSDTTVATAEKGKLSDVKAGDSVTVQGTAGDDGTVTATLVTTTK